MLKNLMCSFSPTTAYHPVGFIRRIRLHKRTATWETSGKVEGKFKLLQLKDNMTPLLWLLPAFLLLIGVVNESSARCAHRRGQTCTYKTCASVYGDWSPSLTDGQCSQQIRRPNHHVETHTLLFDCPEDQTCNATDQFRNICRYNMQHNFFGASTPNPMISCHPEATVAFFFSKGATCVMRRQVSGTSTVISLFSRWSGFAKQKKIAKQER